MSAPDRWAGLRERAAQAELEIDDCELIRELLTERDAAVRDLEQARETVKRQSRERGELERKLAGMIRMNTAISTGVRGGGNKDASRALGERVAVLEGALRKLADGCETYNGHEMDFHVIMEEVKLSRAALAAAPE